MQLPLTLTDRVVFTLQRALHRARDLDERTLGELSLSSREYGLLSLLADGPVARQHELGAALGFDRTTTAALVRGLVERGLVRRSPLPGSGRTLVLELTPAGVRLRAAAAGRLRACEEELLAPLTAVQRAHLRRALLALTPGT